MTGEQHYTVATAAQLLGTHSSPVKKAESAQSSKMKTALKTKNPQQAEKALEILKNVRFTPSTKGNTYEQEFGLYDPPSVSTSTGEDSHSVAKSPKATSMEALRKLSEHHRANSDMNAVPKLSHRCGNDAYDTLGNVHEKTIPLSDQRVTMLKPVIKLDTTYLSTKFESPSDVQGTGVSDIYFTPVNSDRNSTYLSSPMKDITTTPRGETIEQSSNEETDTGHMRFPRPDKLDQKIDLTLTQLDQLMSVLASSPLISNSVHKHWWSDVDEASISSGTSALTLSSNASHRVVAEPTSVPQLEIESPVLGHPIDPLLIRSQDVSSIAIVDPRVHGSPIRFVSRTFRPASIGTCTFLNLPFSSNVESTLRLDSPSINTKHESPTSVTFQIVSRIVDRKSGQRKHLLVSQIDFSHALQAAAIAELAASLDKSPSDITISSLTTTTTTANPPDSASSIAADGADNPRDSSHRCVDWIALADSLQHASDVADAVDAAASQLANLQPPLSTRGPSSMANGMVDEATGPTRETRALLARVERLREAYSRFWILRPGKEVYESGVPRSVGIPWVSGGLYGEWQGAGRGWGEKGGEEMMSALVRRVAKMRKGGHEFEELVRGERVKFVPVFGGVEDGREVGAWVCFLGSGESD